MSPSSPRNDRRLGRCETALERSLHERPDIGKAARGALRVQAHAVDLAEQARDPELITTANGGYLDLLKANGLTSEGAAPVDAFAQLLAELGPTPGASNTPKP